MLRGGGDAGGGPAAAGFASPLSSPSASPAGSPGLGPPPPAQAQSLRFLEDSLSRFGAWRPSPASHGLASGESSPLRYLEHQRHRAEDERLSRRVSSYATSLSPSPLSGPSPGGFPGFSPAPRLAQSPAIDSIRVYSL